MKNALILHGTSGTPNDFWFPWLKIELEKKGYTTSVPQLPNADNPDLKVWLPFILDNFKINAETVIIGHSSGCPLILSILENTVVKIKQVVLVAGFIEPLNGELKAILQENYDWAKIKSHAEEFVFFNSDNDPWGCDDTMGRRMFDSLGGTLIIRHDGHFGSIKYDQPYREFPLLSKLIN